MDDGGPYRAYSAVDADVNPTDERQLVLRRAQSASLYLLHLTNWDCPKLLQKLTGRSYEYPVDGYIGDDEGLPHLREALGHFIQQSEGMAVPPELSLSVAWSGTTRAIEAMVNAVARRRPGSVALVPQPGWGYSVAAEKAGLVPLSYPVDPAVAVFQPSSLEQVAGSLAPARVGLIVVNAQHYPTGVEFGEDAIEAVSRVAEAANAFILADNTYFDMHVPDFVPTSPLRVFSRIRSSERVLYVRSLGKQFGVNGWGLGAIASPADLAKEIQQAIRGHSYVYNGRLQAAMASWLESDSSASFTAARQRTIRHNASTLQGSLLELGFGSDRLKFYSGTPHLIFDTRASSDEEQDVLRRGLLAETGVYVGPMRGSGARGWLSVSVARPRATIEGAAQALLRSRVLAEVAAR